MKGNTWKLGDMTACCIRPERKKKGFRNSVKGGCFVRIKEVVCSSSLQFYVRWTLSSGLLLALPLLALLCPQQIIAQTTPQLSELTLTVNDTVRQQYVAGNIAFDVMVIARDTDNNHLVLNGLLLDVNNISNIRSLQGGSAAVEFSGTPPVGTAHIEVSLLKQALNGQLRLDFANLPASVGRVASTPTQNQKAKQPQKPVNADTAGSTITVVAVADYIGGVSFDINHFFPPDQSNSNRSMAHWLIDGNRLFSRIDRTADSDTSANRDPSRFLPPLDIEIRTFLFNGANGTHVFTSRFDNSLRHIRLQVTPGIGLDAELYSFNSIDLSSNSIELTRIASDIGRYSLPSADPGLTAWFTAPDSSAPRIATLTLSVGGLPPSIQNHIVTAQEFTLIDQVLSTIALSVAKEPAIQSTPGAAVAVTLEVHTYGSFGFDYAKYLDLNLRVSASALALISTSTIRLNFSSNNPVRTTLMVTPSIFDTTLTVMVERRGLPESVALVPAESIEVAVRASQQLARAELLPVVETTQLRLVNPQQPLEIDFQVRAFDRNGVFFDTTVIPAATASIAGAMINISPVPLRLREDGKAIFTVSVMPPPGYFKSFTITVSLDNLPSDVESPAVEITISPEIDTLKVIISASEKIEQNQPNAEIVFDVEVNIWNADDVRISHPGLLLVATAGANTTVSQRTWPVTFTLTADGQPSGSGKIRANLIELNQGGSVMISIAGASNLVLLSSSTVTLVAAEFEAYVAITLNPGDSFPTGTIENHYVFDNNRVELSQPLPLGIFKRDNLQGFSASRLSGNPSPREFRLNIQAYDAMGQPLSLALPPLENISLEMTTGAGISNGGLYTSSVSSESLGESADLVYTLGQGFISSSSDSPLVFAADLNDGVVSATMTLQINGLPNDLLPLQRQIVLIDQQLSTVTLTVDGEIAVQSIPGESVEMQLQVNTHGTLGYPFRKNLALNLVTTGNVEDAEIAPIPLLNFSDDNPRQLTLRVTPTGFDDVSLTVLLDRRASGLPEDVALLPAGGLDLTVRAARQWARTELLLSGDTTQLRQSERQMPVEIDFLVRAFDQDGTPFNAMVIPTATASAVGVAIGIERVPLVLEGGGEATFTVTVRPPAEFFTPFIITVDLAGLPTALQTSAVEVTISPEINTPKVIISVGEQIQQNRPNEEIVFDVAVNIWNVEGARISHPGLLLAVTTGTNTAVSQRTWPVTFTLNADGQPSGSARIRANLIELNQDGSVIIGIAATDSLALLSSRTVTLVAAEFRAYVAITLNLGDSFPAGTIENHYVFDNNSVELSQALPLRIFKRDNLQGFSASRLSGNANPREFRLNIQAYDATGKLLALIPPPLENISLEMTTGAGISNGSLYTSNISSELLGVNTELVYRPGQGFISSDSDSPLVFTADLADGVVSATMTLQISGLPDNLLPLQREIALIDQQLSTVTVTVDGEVPGQSIPGESVEVLLLIDTHGTLGYPFRKKLALNLIATTTAKVEDAEIAPIPLLNFNNDNPRQLILQVTPTGLDDVSLTVLLDRLASGLSEGVALLPAGGLDLTVRAARQLARTELLLAGNTSQLRRSERQMPVEIDFVVRAFDQDGTPFNAMVIPAATASAAGVVIGIERVPLVLEEGTEATFTVTVIPPAEFFTPFIVTVNLAELPSVLQSPTVEITISPEIDTPTVIISVSERIEQNRPNEEVIFDVAVNIWDVDGIRISHPGLLLAVAAGANTAVSQRTWPVTFTLNTDGQPSGSARVRADLIELNRSGSVMIAISGADNLLLLSSRTVTLVAAEFRAYVAITLNPGDSFPTDTIENHYFFDNNSVALTQPPPLRIFKRDNLEAFSASRLSGNPSPREFRLNIQAYDATGERLTLIPSPSGNITLEMATGVGIAVGNLYTSIVFSQALGGSAGLVYSPGQGFISSDSDSPLVFAVDLNDGVVSATMTLQINGLPNNLLPLQREIVLIDQQLSTVTLTVDGEVAIQDTPGESVEIRLQVNTHGSHGYPFRKNLALNLIATGNVENAEIAPIPPLNFRNDNPRQLTLRVTPTGLDDVSLTVLLDRLASGLSEDVALLPTGGLDLTIRAARQLARTELLLAGDTAQLRRSERQMPVEVDFLVRAFDQDGTPFNTMLIPTATASAAGVAIAIERVPLVLEERGEATFTVTVIPPAEFFTPFMVTVSLTGLPSVLQSPTVEITIGPVIDTPTVIISVSERVGQSRPNAEMVFDVAVNIWHVDATRISHPGLQLTVTPGANTAVTQRTWPVTFSAGVDGQFSGNARIRANLIGFNQDGSVMIGISGADNLLLLSSRTVTLAAAEFRAYVAITLNPGDSFPTGTIENHYIFDNNSVSLSQPLPLRIFKRDNLEAFSASRLSSNSNPNSSPREFRLNIQAYDASGLPVTLTSTPEGTFTLEMSTGAGIVAGNLYTSHISSEALGRNTGLVYNSGQGFISGEFSSPLTFVVDLDEEVVSATMTLQVNGLPNNLLPLQREIMLIDQQLSTVTLTVDGEEAVQNTPGESVEIRLQVNTHDTHGYPFRKNLALNLIATGNVEDAEIAPIPPLNFRNDNPRQLTLRITPTGLDDVSLTVLLDRPASDLSEDVALLPTGGLDLTIRAARQLAMVELRAVPETTEVRQVDAELPVHISFEVRGFDQDGIPIEGQLIATATSSVAGTVLAIDQNLPNLSAGMADFVLSVTPTTQEPIMVTVRLTGLSPGLRTPVVRITVIPAEVPLGQLDLNGNGRVDIDELLLIQNWLKQGLLDFGAGGATGATGNDNLTVDSIRTSGLNNLTELYVGGYLNVDENNIVDEFDMRILIRYRAGLRGAALGADASEEKIRLLLGIPLRCNHPLSKECKLLVD